MQNNQARSFTLRKPIKKMAEPPAVVLRTPAAADTIMQSPEQLEISIKERKERQMRRWTADLDDLRAK